MSADFTPLQLATQLGRLHQRVEEMEDLLERLTALLERYERRLTTIEITVLDRDDDPTLN